MSQKIKKLHFFGQEYEIYDAEAARQADLANLVQGNMTQSERDKLREIAAGAQVNVIEEIQINGAPQNNNEKTINLSIPITPGTGTRSAKQGSSQASGADSIALGINTRAFSIGAHSEGEETQAVAQASHAGGKDSIANANYAFAHGLGVTASEVAETALGKYNEHKNGLLFVVGAGVDKDHRKNILEVYENNLIVYVDNNGQRTPVSFGSLATQSFVQQRINEIIGAAPTTLDTLGEIAAVLQSGDIGTITNALQSKADVEDVNTLMTQIAAVENFHDCTVADVDAMFAQIFND